MDEETSKLMAEFRDLAIDQRAKEEEDLIDFANRCYIEEGGLIKYA